MVFVVGRKYADPGRLWDFLFIEIFRSENVRSWFLKRCGICLKKLFVFFFFCILFLSWNFWIWVEFVWLVYGIIQIHVFNYIFIIMNFYYFIVLFISIFVECLKTNSIYIIYFKFRAIYIPLKTLYNKWFSF